MRILWVSLALIGLGTAAAQGDELRATLEQPLFEVSHSVDVSFADGVAVYKVRRVFANPGKLADEAGLEIDLPYGAAATGLRIRARDRWYDGELMEREKAAALYQELTGLGAYAPKDPALLQWLWADKLYLQLFPVLPGQASTVEYTLTVPTRYQGGRVYLSYPRLAAGAPRGLAVPILRVRPAWGNATTSVRVDGVRAAPDTPIVLPAPVAPSWGEAVDIEPGASYVSSVIEVPESAASKLAVSKLKLALDIEHTYKSDLRVDLITPQGKRVVVFGGEGGDSNDVRASFDLKLPAGTRAAGTWRLVVADHVARDAGTLNAWKLDLGAKLKFEAEDLPLFVPDAPESESDAGVASIEIAPPEIDVLAARLGRVVASDQHSFLRLEIDTAPELRPLPKQAQVVFVVDASHSMGTPGIDAQLAVARAYLSHVGDAEVEVVLVRRRATRLFGKFVGAGGFEPALAAARKDKDRPLAPGNGSALDEGTRVAGELLKVRSGPRRMVLLSDDMLRSRFTNALAEAGLAKAPPDTVVHVVLPDDDDDSEVELERDDAHERAPLAARHHGILVTLKAPLLKGHKDLAQRVLALVRPMQIDHFKVSGDVSAEGTLREGDGVRVMEGRKTAPAEVTLSGMIWGDPYKKVVKVGSAFSRATAAFVFSEDEHGDLSEAEQMKVAMFGRAVSPVTSYVAFEPGTRPSTAGIPREMRGGSMGSGYGSGSGYGGGRGRVRVAPDLMALVGPGAKQCVDRIKPAPGWQVTLEVETTRDEVVDVIPGGKAPAALQDCIVEAAWAVRLTSAFDQERETFSLSFP